MNCCLIYVTDDVVLFILTVLTGDGQVDFNEFMTILGPKLLSSETREGFLGNTIDTIFWQVNHLFAQLIKSLKCKIQSAETCDQAVKSTQHLSRVLSWMMALICDSDRCLSVRPKGWQRYQRCRAMLRANVGPVRWKRLTVRCVDGCGGGGGNGNERERAVWLWRKQSARLSSSRIIGSFRGCWGQ